MKYRLYTGIVLVLAIAACVDPLPLASIHYENLLVVEGHVTGELEPQVIKLTRTAPLTEKAVKSETGAQVRIVDSENNAMTANESLPGRYVTPPFAGVIGRQYHIEITTADGKSYQSSSVTMKDVPEIGSLDAVYPSPEPNASLGIQFYINSPDPTGTTAYFRWEYEDTYEIQTPFPSRFIWLGGNDVNVRSTPVDRCWKSDSSKNVFVSDKSKQADSGVKNYPIRFLPADGRELAVKYSILVRQYALDEDAYRYWVQLKKINEEQGSLFDLQPGTIRGNVVSTTEPNEIVLGYFDAGIVRSKRIFVTPRDLAPSGFYPVDYFGICYSINPALVPFDKIGNYMSYNFRTQDITEAGAGDDGPYYIVYPKTCCNCTRDGSNIMPDYWQ